MCETPEKAKLLIDNCEGYILQGRHKDRQENVISTDIES
jgi:hypothetical protein